MIASPRIEEAPCDPTLGAALPLAVALLRPRPGGELGAQPLAGPLAAGTPNGFAVRRGTNVSHWLSQSKRRGEERRRFFTREDVALAAQLGFDHLRLPVDEEQLFDEAGRPVEEAFSLLDAALDWCAEHRLRAIVDLHILRSHHFNEGEKPLWTDPAAQERFLDLWRQLSARLSRRPLDQVAYELMNEPVADDPEEWNRLVARAVRTVRALEPRRTLVIGSNRWQSADTFDPLRVPVGDPNILLSFHFYTPMALTHYGAGWTKAGEYKGPVRYPGEVVAQADLAGLPADLVDAVGGETPTSTARCSRSGWRSRSPSRARPGCRSTAASGALSPPPPGPTACAGTPTCGASSRSTGWAGPPGTGRAASAWWTGRARWTTASPRCCSGRARPWSRSGRRASAPSRARPGSAT